ncbi:MAG TPA: hypothetical protein VFV87_19870 [Pirellulaceae bacterium]|nr:hypothetical protein [Pirellulaceae bacterium]
MNIRDRIKELRRVRAGHLRYPKNWRTHLEEQQNALRGILAEVGYVDALMVRDPSGALGGSSALDKQRQAIVRGRRRPPVRFAEGNRPANVARPFQDENSLLIGPRKPTSREWPPLAKAKNNENQGTGQ